MLTLPMQVGLHCTPACAARLQQASGQCASARERFRAINARETTAIPTA